MATFTKRGKRWYVQVRRKGSPPQCRTFASKADAKAWAVLEESKIESGILPVATKLLRKTTLSDLLDRYIAEVTPTKRSACSEKSRLEKLRRDPIAVIALADLSPEHFASYRDRRLEMVKAGTVKRELSLLHHAIDIGRKEWGLRLGGNPVSEISQPKLNNARDRRLHPGELRKLEAAFEQCRNPVVGHVIRFAIESAMRRGEILAMRWSHVDLAQHMVHIPLTKTGKPRTIPLTDQAIAILKAQEQSGGLVFPITANALKLAWVRVTKRAGLADLHFHDLRHEAVSRFFEMGLSLPEVAIISGHRDPRMLFRYTHLRPIALAEKLKGRSWNSMAA